MGYLDRFTRSNSPLGKSALVVTGLEVATGFGLGYWQGTHREKAQLFGQPIDLVGGLALKGLSLAASMGVRGPMGLVAKAAPYANSMGTAALVCWAHTHGVGSGSQQSGVKRVGVKNDQDLAKVMKAVPDAVILGAIPSAPHGDFLRPDQVEALANR